MAVMNKMHRDIQVRNAVYPNFLMGGLPVAAAHISIQISIQIVAVRVLVLEFVIEFVPEIVAEIVVEILDPMARVSIQAY